jgi:iron complex outermembrane recepter protein
MRTIKRRDLSGQLAALAILVGPWGASALAAQANADSSTRASETIDTVIVTATKREENLQDVPVAISAFSEEALREGNVQDARDLNAPNFVFPQMYTTSRSYISVRGIFQEVNNIGFDGGFSAYLDGVYLGRNMAYDVDMAGIERVEILRGPQGTLFGKNTIGGLMNVISKRPSQQFEGNVQAEFGNMNLRRVRGSVNLPIAQDVLAARLSVQKVDRDGYVTNLTGGPDGGSIDVISSRAQVLFTPVERLEVSLSLDYLDSDNIGYSSEVIASQSTVPELGDDRPFTYHPNKVPVERKWDKGAALTADYELGGGQTITSISGVRRTRTSWVLDGDATALDFYTENLNDQQDLLSQELRLASASGSKLDYVLGLYYYDEDADATDPIPFTALYPGGPFLVYYNTRVNTEDYAAFAHLDWHLTDALTLYGGMRYTDETKELESERRVLPFSYVIPRGFVPGLTTDGTGMPP